MHFKFSGKAMARFFSPPSSFHVVLNCLGDQQGDLDPPKAGFILFCSIDDTL